MKKEELRTAIQEMNTYQFGQKKELTNKLSKVTSYVAKQEVLEMVSKLDKEVKAELPVIPQFVAEYIKVSKDDNESLNQAFAFIDDKENKELWNWMFPTMYEGKRENQETFARAWLDGYTIEKEKKYRVLFPMGINPNKLIKKISTGAILVDSELYYSRDTNDEFTEQEIKAIDERYWAFREEVENA